MPSNADIRITFGEVREKAGTVRAHNNRLTEILVECQRAINALESDWTSDTSDTIRQKITALKKRIDKYQEIIESYAKFLDTTADTYERTEGTLNQNADSQFAD